MPDPVVPPDVVGTTRDGLTLAAGMAAFPAMVKGQIGSGRTLSEGLLYGQFLAHRFADAEVTGAVDRVEEAFATRSGVRGWVGIVSPTACDDCRGRNSGFHPIGVQMYRHGGCACSKRFVRRPL